MTDPKETASPSVRRLTVGVEGYADPFKFAVALSDFQEFQREAQRDAAMATNNFLLRTCTEPTRDQLMSHFQEHWGLSGIIMEKVAAELVDLRAAHLKNSKGA